MNTCNCKVGPSLALLCVAVLVALYLLPRQDEPTDATISTVRSLLRPTFSQWRSRSPSSPSDLSVKEALEARVLALRQYCDHQDTDGETTRRRVEKSRRSVQGQLAWCGHPLTISPETAANLERLADQNRKTVIQMDRDNYYSMPAADNSSGMSWHIVEHPLLVLTRAFVQLRSGQPRWEVLARQRSGVAVTLSEVLQMAVGDDPLPATADTCAVCTEKFDFVLHAGELDTEVAFLVGEMGWTNTWSAAVEPSREQLLRELVRQLPSVPRQLLELVKQRFGRDLEIYGFDMDVDALYDAVL